jgi:hypothetical protein
MFPTDFCALAIDFLLRPSKVSEVVTFMAKSPIITTLDTLVADLKDSMQILRDKEKHVTGLTAAIKSLAGVCEDEEVRTDYLLLLEEITGKPGFVDAVRSALKGSPSGLTAAQVKQVIVMTKKMDLSAYSNPMASIHTTLRRFKEKGEVEETTNETGDKVYRWKMSRGEAAMRAALARKKNPAFYGQ